MQGFELKVTLQSSNGLSLKVTGGGEGSPAEEPEQSNEELEKISDEVALELLEAKTQSIVCLTDGSNNAHKAFEVAKAAEGRRCPQRRPHQVGQGLPRRYDQFQV